ncbi:flavohemoglobin expression-modulating QEGLA motif protein [Aegicerativicinus sediminis]
MTEKFHSMLIMEFWPENSNGDYCFKISAPKGDSLPTTKALAEGFKQLSEFNIHITNKISKKKPRQPDHLKPLLEDGELKKLGAILYGVGIPTIYRNEPNKELYYLFYRKFHSIFSETVMRSAYEFIRVQTANPFDNYLMFGKTSLDEITLKSDKELAEISEGMSFLLRTTPVNSYEEWIKFKENNYKKTPSFNYRLIAIDPEIEKRKLFNVPIDQIEDPTIAFILRGKRLEIEKQLTMLEERGTTNFKHVGNSLYGVIQRNTLKEAKKILRTFPKKQNLSGKKRYDCFEFASIAQKEIDYYQECFPDIPLKIEIRDDIAGIMVSKTKLLVSSQLSINSKRADALIQHEVGTHIVTYCNGKMQPLEQMYAGFEGYDQLQEGIAVLAEYLVDGLTVTRLRLLAGRVVAVDSMVKGANFKETFRLLTKNHNFSPTSAYYITMRVYRGGGLTKDAVYLAGLIDVLNYLKKGGDLNILYCGKFNTNHIELIQELLYRGVLNQPKLPRFLERPQVQQRLTRLRNGIEITDMVSD